MSEELFTPTDIDWELSDPTPCAECGHSNLIDGCNCPDNPGNLNPCPCKGQS